MSLSWFYFPSSFTPINSPNETSLILADNIIHFFFIDNMTSFWEWQRRQRSNVKRIHLFEPETSLAIIILKGWRTQILSLDLTFDMNEHLIGCQHTVCSLCLWILNATNEKILSRAISSDSLVFTPYSSFAFLHSSHITGQSPWLS